MKAFKKTSIKFASMMSTIKINSTSITTILMVVFFAGMTSTTIITP